MGCKKTAICICIYKKNTVLTLISSSYRQTMANDRDTETDRKRTMKQPVARAHVWKTKTDDERIQSAYYVCALFFIWSSARLCVVVVFYAVLYFEMRATLWMKKPKMLLVTEPTVTLTLTIFANTHSDMHTHMYTGWIVLSL